MQATFRDRKSPILPIGQVNTKTGANKEFGTMWNCWEEDAADTNELWTNDEGKFIAVHTSSESSHKIGDYGEFKHDQTWRTIGGWRGWKFVGAFAHTKEGVRELGLAAGKTSVSFYTYK